MTLLRIVFSCAVGLHAASVATALQAARSEAQLRSDPQIEQCTAVDGADLQSTEKTEIVVNQESIEDEKLKDKIVISPDGETGDGPKTQIDDNIIDIPQNVDNQQQSEQQIADKEKQASEIENRKDEIQIEPDQNKEESIIGKQNAIESDSDDKELTTDSQQNTKIKDAKDDTENTNDDQKLQPEPKDDTENTNDEKQQLSTDEQRKDVPTDSNEDDQIINKEQILGERSDNQIQETNQQEVVEEVNTEEKTESKDNSEQKESVTSTEEEIEPAPYEKTTKATNRFRGAVRSVIKSDAVQKTETVEKAKAEYKAADEASSQMEPTKTKPLLRKYICAEVTRQNNPDRFKTCQLRLPKYDACMQEWATDPANKKKFSQQRIACCLSLKGDGCKIFGDVKNADSVLQTQVEMQFNTCEKEAFTCVGNAMKLETCIADKPEAASNVFLAIVKALEECAMQEIAFTSQDASYMLYDDIYIANCGSNPTAYFSSTTKKIEVTEEVDRMIVNDYAYEVARSLILAKTFDFDAKTVIDVNDNIEMQGKLVGANECITKAIGYKTMRSRKTRSVSTLQNRDEGKAFGHLLAKFAKIQECV